MKPANAVHMPMIYISHPYRAETEEEQEANRRRTQVITARLMRMYPDIIFFNPLDAMQSAAGILPEETIVEQCARYVAMADAVILRGDWEHSQGCAREFLEARNRNIPLYTSIENFELFMKNNGFHKEGEES